MIKIIYFLCITLTCCLTLSIKAQTSPVSRFELQKELNQQLSDSLGTTYLYSLSFESMVDSLSSVTFKLRSTATDSLINQQVFSLPHADGVYQTGAYTNGLIKDKNVFFIILGAFKHKDPLILVSDFIDSKNTIYNNIPTND